MYAIAGTLRRPGMAVTMSKSVNERELRIAFEGRLDDRNDLLAQLSLSWQASDVDIIAAAYRRWDVAFLEQIEGEFVLALWDERNQRLLLARDRFGLHPLYVHTAPDTLTWSSHVKAIADDTRCDRTPDPHFVAGFLTFGRRGDVSPFAAIRSIPPAGMLVVDRKGESMRTYWRLDPEAEIRLKSDAEYEERFFSLFQRSVSNRLPAEETVFCELSGGVDSSSIFAIADGIHRAQQRPHQSLQSISHIYDESGSADDRPYIAVMEQAFGRPSYHAIEARTPVLSTIGDAYPYDEPTPSWSGEAMYGSIADQVLSRGGAVLLCGMGGDDLTWSEIDNPPSIADHFAQGRWLRALRESHRWAAALRKPRTSVIRDAWRETRNAVQVIPPPWIDARFARQTGVDDLRGDAETQAFARPSRRIQFVGLRNLAVEIGFRRQTQPELDLRYPFIDRKLIEFAFAVPLDQHLRPGETRSLQRRAMARVLPPDIAQRRTKGGPGGTIYRRFRENWPAIKSIFAKARVVELGYVDAAKLAASLQRAAHGVNASGPGLLRLIALESWLRTLERRSVAVDPRDRLRSSSTGRR